MNLYKHVSDAINRTLGFEVNLEVPKNREFGDFSTNAAMVMASKNKLSSPADPQGPGRSRAPRELAAEILPKIAELDFVAETSIAGPGFINIKIKDDFIWQSANQKSAIINHKSEVIDLDYGAYNVAKSLHIGHLRTGIVGDTLNRIAKFLGHKTISYNHIGDWGRPMGLVIAWFKKNHPDWPFFQPDFDKDKINPGDYAISAAELDTYYPAASAYAKENEEFLDHARKITADFQNGHPGYTALYDIFLKVSLDAMDDIIRRLNMMPFDRTLGERNAAKYVPDVEKELREKNLIRADGGAEIVDVRRDADTAPMPPLMFRNSRDADTYAARDLAAIWYRKKQDDPDAIWYLTDARQQLHFQQVFRVSDMMGMFPLDRFAHLYFGTINGPGGTPFKTRDGNAAGLIDIMEMINDAVRARVSESGKTLPDDTIGAIALAALKFNDLTHDVKSDYVFDPAAVTSFEGRTGPYILYTAVRLNSVLKRVGNNKSEIRNQKSEIGIDERNLLIGILDFERVVQSAFDNRATDLVANYAYDLCQLINTFYHNCPMLREDISKDVRARRLGIAQIAFEALATVIDLMGLNIPAEM
jgi:arginyl-tRNA synthetase